MSKSEDTWIASQRKVVQEYLQRERVDHLGVGEYPAFHVHPYVAVWAVQSKKAPGWVGWWAISGDLPTDYVSRGKIAHPREALRAFADHWREMSDFMLRGEEHPDVKIGTPDQWPELGDLLRRRAQILQSYADDDDIWEEELAERSTEPPPSASADSSDTSEGRRSVSSIGGVTHMSAWRREALQRLPECRKLIEAAQNPMALWIELLGECQDACKKQNEDSIRRLYDYARWCWQSRIDDVVNAVACAFYEHLPTTPILRRDMPRRFGRSAFKELRDVFCYHLSPEEAAAFEREFYAAEQKFVREAL